MALQPADVFDDLAHVHFKDVRRARHYIAGLAYHTRTLMQAATAALQVPVSQARIILADSVQAVADELDTRVALVVAELVNGGKRENNPPHPGRFKAFVASPRFGGLLQEYPLLAEDLERTARNWSQGLARCFERLARDRDMIAEEPIHICTDDPVAGVEVLDADPHFDGSRPVLLSFSSGRRLVYKPRGERPGLVFKSFVDIIFSGLESEPLWRLRPRVPASIHVMHGGHAWVEFIKHAPPADEAEAELYAERAGAVLAVAACLGFTDGHVGNLVCNGAHPVIIDYETLFTPYADGGDKGSLSRPIEMLLRTGLLQLPPNEDSPLAVWSSAFQGTNGEAQFVPHILNDGTDDVSISFRKPDKGYASGLNLKPRGNPVEHHHDAFLKGFEASLRLVCDRWPSVLARTDFWSAAEATPYRCILRPTTHYLLAAYTLLQPDALATQLASRIAAERVLGGPLLSMVTSTNFSLPMDQVLQDEVDDLVVRKDVPLFEALGVNLRSSAGRIYSNFVPKSGVAAARNAVRVLLNDVAQTTACVAAILLESPRNIKMLSLATPYDVQNAILQRLLDDVPRCCAAVARNPWGSASLYDGALGIGVTLSAFGHLDAAAQLVSGVASRAVLGEVPDHVSLGVAGIGGLIYGFLRLHADCPMRSQYQQAVKGLLRTVSNRGCGPQAIEKWGADVVHGAAGLLLAMHAVHSTLPDLVDINFVGGLLTSLTTARQNAADGMFQAGLDESSSSFSGFSHGQSGVAFAILCWKEELPIWNEEFENTAKAAVRAEDALLFSAHRKNWSRSLARTDQCGFSWCHGTPGICAARAAAGLPLPFAVQPTREFGKACVDQDVVVDDLCCGTAGIIDILVTLGQIDEAMAVAQQARKRAAARGSFAVTNITILRSSSLYKGLAGVLYGMVGRLKQPPLPSVLMMEMR